MEKKGVRIVEFMGIFLILGIIGVILLYGQWAKQREERDRLLLEDVQEARVALQQYYETNGVFPDDLSALLEAANSYMYDCVKGDEGGCVDYILRFMIVYGSGPYAKGEYVANKSIIDLAK